MPAVAALVSTACTPMPLLAASTVPPAAVVIEMPPVPVDWAKMPSRSPSVRPFRPPAPPMLIWPFTASASMPTPVPEKIVCPELFKTVTVSALDVPLLLAITPVPAPLVRMA